jgi:hypothetical protein
MKFGGAMLEAPPSRERSGEACFAFALRPARSEYFTCFRTREDSWSPCRPGRVVIARRLHREP